MEEVEIYDVNSGFGYIANRNFFRDYRVVKYDKDFLVRFKKSISGIVVIGGPVPSGGSWFLDTIEYSEQGNLMFYNVYTNSMDICRPSDQTVAIILKTEVYEIFDGLELVEINSQLFNAGIKFVSFLPENISW